MNQPQIKVELNHGPSPMMRRLSNYIKLVRLDSPIGSFSVAVAFALGSVDSR